MATSPARATPSVAQYFPDVVFEEACHETIKSLGPSHVFPRGVELFRQGSVPRYVYYLERGLIKSVFCGQDGREVITNLSGSCCLLGASALILKEPHVVSVVTVQRCELRYIEATDFDTMMTTDHRLCNYVNRLLSREVSDHVVHGAELATMNARSRLEQLLWDMISNGTALEQESPVSLLPPIKQSEIAALIAVTPQYLSCLFKKLEREGILVRQKRGLMIVNSEALTHRT